MTEILDTVLLLALPASGKSEVRRYLAHVAPDARRDDFHMGDTVQLDDFPYVHMMRRVDEVLDGLGHDRVFFHAADRPFQDGRQWGTLIELVNEDYADLVTKRRAVPASAGAALLDRIEAAAARVGAASTRGLAPGARGRLAAALEAEAREMLLEKHAHYPDTLSGRTLVIEFARGGPDGAAPPLPSPLGYRHSIALLAPAILERARVLYIWVTPEESRRKNAERADPNDPGSILHHGVPVEVMMKDYGCDDMDWLEASSDRPGTLAVPAHGCTYHLPVARFDNRIDRTSFIRKPPASWGQGEVKAVHEGLKSALSRLATAKGPRA